MYKLLPLTLPLLHRRLTAPAEAALNEPCGMWRAAGVWMALGLGPKGKVQRAEARAASGTQAEVRDGLSWMPGPGRLPAEMAEPELQNSTAAIQDPHRPGWTT
mmetsp:Transcript_11099/g.34039  ORF Transcript_11099/g.34039 Transcript_11099/m.34039 type:complete len:103 (-) Transcript_11099:1879-2187(-)